MGKPSHPEIIEAGTTLATGLIDAHGLGRQLDQVFERVWQARATLARAGIETRVVFDENPPLHAAWNRWRDDKEGITKLIPPVLRVER